MPKHHFLVGSKIPDRFFTNAIFTANVFLFYPEWGIFKEKWWHCLSFSYIVYYIGITGYTNHRKPLIRFKIRSIGNKSVHLLENDNTESLEIFDGKEVVAAGSVDHRQWPNYLRKPPILSMSYSPDHKHFCCIVVR